MGKGIESVNTAAYHVLMITNQILRHAVDAAYRRDDPDLIANSRTSVFTAIAKKGSRCCLWGREYLMPVDITDRFRKPGTYIMYVYPGSLFNIFFGKTDRIAVFDDRLPGPDRLEGDLMTPADIFACLYQGPGDEKFFSFPDILKGNGDIIIWMDLNQFHKSKHLAESFRKLHGNKIVHVFSSS